MEEKINLYQDNNQKEEGEVDVNFAYSTFAISYEIEEEAKTNSIQREKKWLNSRVVMKHQICLQN